MAFISFRFISFGFFGMACFINVYPTYYLTLTVHYSAAKNHAHTGNDEYAA